MQPSRPFTKASSLMLLICAIQTLAQTAPPCWQDCTKTTLPACSVTDLTCICSSLPTSKKLSPFIACIAISCDSSSPGQALSAIVSNCQLSKTPLAPSIISQAIKAVPTTGITQLTILLAIPTSSITVTQHSSTVAPVATSAAAAATKKGNGDGTVLNLEGVGIKRERGCLLGLTVGILAGIAWF